MTKRSKTTKQAEPNPGKSKNHRTEQFNALYAKLPRHIQELSRAAFKTFLDNPDHPSLRRHPLGDNKRGSHLPGSFSVSITMQYRSIYVVKGEVNIWYWTGTHAEYDRFTGKS